MCSNAALTGSPRRLLKPLPPKYRKTEDVWDIKKRAIPYGGAQKSSYLMEWNAAGKCQSPVTVSLSGRPYMDVQIGSELHTGIDIEVRCRKCEACLKARAALWRDRAIAETNQSSRTWFGTLTLSPEQHMRCLSIARQIEALQGCDFDAFDHEEQFQLRVAVIGKEITKFLKRVRKESGCEIRYILVAEAHKSGDPHFHMLIHEPHIDQPVRKSVLKRHWTMGFSQWKLADVQAAYYVCKYLVKCSMARVRASLHYGTNV